MTDSPQRLKGRVALVTGASRGIGRALAEALAREGAHIVAVARNVEALESLDDAIRKTGGSATLVPLDLKDAGGIERLGHAVTKRWGKLDVLAGSAGVLGALMPMAQMDAGVWAELIEVNVTANLRLIGALDPALRESDAGRAVFITSGAAQRLRPFFGGYATSKAALEAIVKTYALEIAGTKARANLFNPGPTRTAMRAKAFPGEDPATLPKPEEVAREIVKLCLPEFTGNGEVVTFSRRAKESHGQRIASSK